MKKILFLIVILFCTYSCTLFELNLLPKKVEIPIVEYESSSRDQNLPDSLTYQVIEIVNPILYNMLDSVINLSKETIFAIHEQPVRFTFFSNSKNDTIFFSLRARQYDYSFYGNIINDYIFEPQNKYCFVYKEVWFTGNVIPYEKDYFSYFFKLTDQEKKLNIYFSDKKVYYWDSDRVTPFYIAWDEANVSGRIYNDTLVEMYGWLTKKIDVIYHIVKKYETLSELAEKYRTSEKRICELNPQLLLEEKLPVKKKIRVQ